MRKRQPPLSTRIATAFARLQENATKLKDASVEHARSAQESAARGINSIGKETRARIRATLEGVQSNVSRLTASYLEHARSAQREATLGLSTLATLIREAQAEVAAHRHSSTQALKRADARTKAAVGEVKAHARVARNQLSAFVLDFGTRRARIVQTATDLVANAKRHLREAKDRASRSKQAVEVQIADLVQTASRRGAEVVENVRFLSRVE